MSAYPSIQLREAREAHTASIKKLVILETINASSNLTQTLHLRQVLGPEDYLWARRAQRPQEHRMHSLRVF
jgi:hypothetical protein